MIRTTLLVIPLILVSACGMTSPATPPPVENISLEDPATPTVLPTDSPTQSPPTAPPAPAIDPNLFRDDFNQTLDEGWSWLREDTLHWSLTNAPGSLQINVSDGYIAAHNNSNLLLRPAPVGDFQIETQITFRPLDNFQFAGLIIYQSDSNFIQAGREFCNAVGCMGEGLYMETYQKGVIVKPGVGVPFREDIPILIRLSRRGETYTFGASTDGKVWFSIGSLTNDMEPLQIGLVTGKGIRGEIQPAAFQYFMVRSLP